MDNTLRWMVRSPPGEWVVRNVNRLLLGSLQYGPVPKHIAFVMDGNRRYARHRRMETLEGHGQGFVTLARVLEMSYSLGVKVVTVYAFAVANFQRSSYEVEGLLEMAKVKLQELTNEGEVLDRYGARVRILGERSMIREDVLKYVERAEEMTKHNTEAVLNICFPYGSREEITAAIRSTVEEYITPPAPQRTMFSQSRISRGIMTRQASVLPTIRDASPAPSATSEGRSSPTLGPGSPSPQAKSHTSDDNTTTTRLSPENITVESLGKHMYTAEDPPVDLFIRTSGVERLSDFLTWQCHQDTYIAFAKCLWPDFGVASFIPILLEWQWWQRQREKDQVVQWKMA